MDFKDDSIFFIVPCFNEEKRLVPSYWNELLNNSKINLIFIDDGSKDKTLELLNEIKSNNKKVTLLTKSKNEGKAEAIRSGFNYVLKNQISEKKSIGYLDADSAFSVKDVLEISDLSGSKEKDLIDLFIGSRVALQGKLIIRNNFRHIISRIIVTILGYFYPSIPYDIQSGLKIFKLQNNDQKIFDKKFKTRWFVDLEIILRLNSIRNKKITIWEEPVSYWKEIKGSKINFKEKIRIILEIFYTIVLILRKKKWI